MQCGVRPKFAGAIKKEPTKGAAAEWQPAASHNLYSSGTHKSRLFDSAGLTGCKYAASQIKEDLTGAR